MDLISNFKAITASESSNQQIKNHLEIYGWNLERAIERFFEGGLIG
jgi:hypothetical protein